MLLNVLQIQSVQGGGCSLISESEKNQGELHRTFMSTLTKLRLAVKHLLVLTIMTTHRYRDMGKIYRDSSNRHPCIGIKTVVIGRFSLNLVDLEDQYILNAVAIL